MFPLSPQRIGEFRFCLHEYLMAPEYRQKMWDEMDEFPIRLLFCWVLEQPEYAWAWDHPLCDWPRLCNTIFECCKMEHVRISNLTDVQQLFEQPLNAEQQTWIQRFFQRVGYAAPRILENFVTRDGVAKKIFFQNFLINVDGDPPLKWVKRLVTIHHPVNSDSQTTVTASDIQMCAEIYRKAHRSWTFVSICNSVSFTALLENMALEASLHLQYHLWDQLRSLCLSMLPTSSLLCFQYNSCMDEINLHCEVWDHIIDDRDRYLFVDRGYPIFPFVKVPKATD